MVVCEFCKRDVHAVTQAASWSPKMVCYDCLSNDGEEPQPLFPNRSFD
jgi:hypothetical protein|tara:strand:- start:328 stop:471 length:144 start_codon:yes stop_codon:yes gene_type:complete